MWLNDFNCLRFFSHGVSNSCGVLIAYLGKNSYILNEQKTDNTGRILIFDITLHADQFVLSKLYNANTVTELVKSLEEFQSMFKNLDISQNKRIIFTGDFNIFFNSKLEPKGGKPLLKRKPIAKLVEINERIDICDIWRIRNPNNRYFTFRENHLIGFIECRLDYIFISNCLQEFVNNTNIYHLLYQRIILYYGSHFYVINLTKMVTIFGDLIIL